MSWIMPKIWKDGECWIIGGGPSLTRQFSIPDYITKDVRDGKSFPNVYSPYLEFLHTKHVIGINMAFKIGDWIDILFFGDQSFYKRVKDEIHFFPGLKITCNHNTGIRFPNVKHMKRMETKNTYGLTSDPSALKWNTNSGGAAINLAIHTGVKKIYLLGYDMKSTEEAKHWHTLYGKGNLTLPYKTHKRCFPKIAEDAKALGVEIINVNPDSEIDSFPRISLKELL